MAHWGDWAIPQFNFRIIGEIHIFNHLVEIFGEELMWPRERADLGGYNPDPNYGEVVGFLCFIDRSNNFTFSVRFKLICIIN